MALIFLAFSDNVPDMFTQRKIDLFNAKLIRRGDDECWDWSAAKDKLGYGVMCMVNPKTGRTGSVRAHQISFYLHHGRMPVGDVMHLCHNPSCANPAHLREGTRSENMMTSYYSGRLQRKLPLEDIPAIVQRCKTPSDMREVAREYNCSYVAVRHMVRRHSQVGISSAP